MHDSRQSAFQADCSFFLYRMGVDARTVAAPQEISLTPYGGLIKKNTMGDARTGVAPHQFRFNNPYGAQPRTIHY